MSATEADREKAREIILAGDSGPESWTQVLADALAEERAKARELFLALGREYANIARSVPDEADSREVKWVYLGVSADIELAAEETE